MHLTVIRRILTSARFFSIPSWNNCFYFLFALSYLLVNTSNQSRSLVIFLNWTRSYQHGKIVAFKQSSAAAIINISTRNARSQNLQAPEAALLPETNTPKYSVPKLAAILNCCLSHHQCRFALLLKQPAAIKPKMATQTNALLANVTEQLLPAASWSVVWWISRAVPCILDDRLGWHTMSTSQPSTAV